MAYLDGLQMMPFLVTTYSIPLTLATAAVTNRTAPTLESLFWIGELTGACFQPGLSAQALCFPVGPQPVPHHLRAAFPSNVSTER